MPRIRKHTDEFCVARLVGKIGLVRLGAMPDLQSAKARIKLLAASENGEYVVYSQDNGRVLAKAGRKPRRSAST